jgi:hypothetical protein
MRRLSGDIFDVEDSQVLIAAIVDFSVKSFREQTTTAKRKSKSGDTLHETRHLRAIGPGGA